MRIVAVLAIAACGSHPRAATPSKTTIVVSAKGVFDFEAPAPVRELKTRGIDSLVGAYEVGGCRLHFEYAEVTNDLTPWSLAWPIDYRSRVGTLEGHPTRWATWSAIWDDGSVHFNAAVYIYTGLNVTADCPHGDLVPPALTVLETIRLRKPVFVDKQTTRPQGSATWATPDVLCKQEQVKGPTSVHVTVVDDHEHPVDQAFVHVTLEPLEIIDALSDRDGFATLKLRPGKYVVQADMPMMRLMGDAVATIAGGTDAGGICRDVVVSSEMTTNIVVRVAWF